MKSRVRGLVRLHLSGDPRSVEGILTGIVEGHYRLAKSRLLNDTNPEHDTPIDGESFWPVRQILYVQKLGSQL